MSAFSRTAMLAIQLIVPVCFLVGALYRIWYDGK